MGAVEPTEELPVAVSLPLARPRAIHLFPSRGRAADTRLEGRKKKKKVRFFFRVRFFPFFLLTIRCDRFRVESGECRRGWGPQGDWPIDLKLLSRCFGFVDLFRYFPFCNFLLILV